MKKTFKLKALAFSILLLVLPLSAAFAQFSSNPSAGGSALDRIMAERGITDLDGRGGADLERYLNSIKDKDQLAAYHAAISKELADTTKVYNDAKAICDLWDKRDGLLKWLDEERRKHQGALATPLEIIGDTSKPFKVQSDTRVKQTRYVYKRVIRLAPDGNGALCDRNALAEAQARKALLEKAHNHTRRAVETFDERRSEWVREIYSDRGFFTPNPGDLSIVLLGRVFGVVGNVLPGGGNQILGSLIGIFNAAWVVAIGLGVFWIVFSSVVAAAGSGEMMAGKGKKTVFHIIRIVVGFSLVVPSATTGYSLAQTATMWVAVQGVGMGSRVYERFNDFIKVSGSVVQTKPLKSEELEEIMPMSLAILQATTCMYKLQDLLGHTSRLDNEVSNQLSEFSDVAAANNRPTNPMEHVGYGVNSDNTITFGTRRKGSSDPQYNSECGRIQLDTFAYQNFPELMKVLEEMRRQDKSSSTVIDLIALVNQTGDSKYKDLHIALAGSGDDYKTQLTMGQIEALFKELTTYQRLAALETILQVRPVARNIAAADIRALQHEDKKGVLNAIMKESAKGMGDSVIAFATIFDPIRTRFTDTGDGNRQNRLKQMRELGWLYTPLVALDATRA
ncbi:MAG: DotA, partial [Gammaproteobacteria bacterium]|nr:DotA [Gammaproteobacteria bacterium]